jgi:hypothetical protein
MPHSVLDESFVIDAAANRFTCQKLASTRGHVTIAGSGEKVCGVLQETVSAADAAAGRVAAVRTQGVARCIASEAIAIGADVRCAANGKVQTMAPSTNNQNRVGVARTAASADGDWIDVALTLDQIDT